MKALRRTLRRTGAFVGRTRHAFDLWNRLGFAWSRAWQIAGTWQ